jgi:glycosyltransferase involved in cell wall biosynthesis
MQVSAYIPCYNGAATLGRAIEGLKGQEQPVDELFVVDNGSTDGSARVAEEAGVRVVRIERTLGRGACRARAMEEARHPLVASCDSGIVLPRDFVGNAARWFDVKTVAAVVGRIAQEQARTATDRWRGRHLFRTDKRIEVLEYAVLTTGGAMVRASAAREAGGYDVNCLHGEDAKLGQRLIDRGYKVIFDPGLVYWQTGSNTAAQVLERYWRWNRAAGGRMSFSAYLRQIKYSVTVMAREDMETADVGAALISLVSPHYQFWRDRME